MHLANPLVVIYLLITILTGAAGWLTFRSRHKPGAGPLGVAISAVAAWSLLSAMLQHPWFYGDVVFSLLVRLVWVPVGVIAVAWLVFTLEYSGREAYVTRRTVGLLSVLPGVTVLVALCHPILLSQAATVLEPVGLDVLAERLSPLADAYDTVVLVNQGYVYLLLGAGSLLLLEMLFERPSVQVSQVLLVCMVVPPWLLNALQLFVFRFSSFNPTILGFAVTGVAGLFAVGRFRLFDVPLARSRIVEELDDGVLVYGRDDRVYDFNERAASLLDLSASAVGSDVRTVMADSPLAFDLPAQARSRVDIDQQIEVGGQEEVGPDASAGRDTVVDGGTSPLGTAIHGQTVTTDTGDDTTYVEARVSELSNRSGKPTGRVVRFHDVTQRERRKRTLERSRERYRTLFTNNQLIQWEMDLSAARRYAVSLVDDDENLAAHLDEHPEELAEINRRIEIIDVNEKALDFYGADSMETLLENLHRTITEDSVEPFIEVWQQVLGGESTIRTECKVRTLDGDTRYELLEWNVLDGHTDEYSRVYATSRDVTERREREQELRRKNEFLDEFTEVVSHDVATPLNVIENKTRLIELTGDSDHAEDIYDSTQRIQELISELRNLAEQGREIGETEAVAIDAVARDAWQNVPSGKATVSVVDPGTVDADRDRLQQLFENLFENAVTHGRRSEREYPVEAEPSARPSNIVESDGTDSDAITVTVGSLPDGFYVEDDGRGIPSAKRDEVFEQGYTTGDGTGLGLAIVHRIVAAHGWTVDLTDGNAGGARFEIQTID